MKTYGNEKIGHGQSSYGKCPSCMCAQNRRGQIRPVYENAHGELCVADRFSLPGYKAVCSTPDNGRHSLMCDSGYNRYLYSVFSQIHHHASHGSLRRSCLKTYYNEKNRREQIRYLCENPPGESALAENAPGDDCVAGENALAENAPGDDCVAGEGARDESAFGGDCAAGESARDENPPGEGALAENASGDDCVAGESARDELCAAENPSADNCAQNRFGQSIFNSRAPGFTFVETLAAISIGAILAAGAGLSAAKLIDAARKTAAENQIAVFKAALQTYYVDCGRFPSEPQGLIALWEKPSLSPVPAGWHGPYLDRETIRDPWGNSYIYEENQNRDGVLPFVIISLGADGREGGKGIDSDIFSWK